MEGFGNREKEIGRMLYLLKEFVKISLYSKKIDFMSPSTILKKLEPHDSISIPESVPHSGSTFKNSEVLRKEALRYLYSLEDKIKKTSDPDLLYQWRILQSSDHIMNIIEDEDLIEGKLSHRLSSAMHERFQNYMNALSCLDIHAHNILKNSII
jgi:hypothetical protein